MALQNSIGYVRLSINTGFDEKTMSVNWMTFSNTDWKESNPERVFSDILETGSCGFDLSVKDGEEIIGYLPQSMEQAHLLLKEMNIKGAQFANYEFEIIEVEINGETKVEQELNPLWSPDLKIQTGEVYQFFDGESWGDYECLQDHASTKELVPNKATEYWKLADVKTAIEESTINK